MGDAYLEDIVRTTIDTGMQTLAPVFGFDVGFTFPYAVSFKESLPQIFYPQSEIFLDEKAVLFNLARAELNSYYIGSLMGEYFYHLLHPKLVYIPTKKEKDEFDRVTKDFFNEITESAKEDAKEAELLGKKISLPKGPGNFRGDVKCCPGCTEHHAMKNLVQFFMHASGLLSGTGSGLYFHPWDLEKLYRKPKGKDIMEQLDHINIPVFMRGWYFGMKAAQMLYDKDHSLLRTCIMETAPLKFRQACKAVKARTSVDFFDNQLKF